MTEYPFDSWGFQFVLTLEDHLQIMQDLLDHYADIIDMLEEACDGNDVLLADLVDAQEQYMMLRQAYEKMKHGGNWLHAESN
jgi:SepF-like predicted cell division protein (DUF552 family)|tara:strand:- start:79 stop:324 length:246 start_codon:yes stop_codon:yes gene_type:complete